MLNKDLAQSMLEHKAVKLSPNEPFTWASGIKSPIYCDQRILLSYPETRSQIIEAYIKLIKEKYPNVEAIIGTATSGIPYGALIADKLNLPFAYVRASKKEHGRKQNIEGQIKDNAKVIVIEDLISTGKSVLEVVDILQEAKYHVITVLANFTYQLEIAQDNFKRYNVGYETLTDIDTLLEVAKDKHYIDEDDQQTVIQFLSHAL